LAKDIGSDMPNFSNHFRVVFYRSKVSRSSLIGVDNCAVFDILILVLNRTHDGLAVSIKYRRRCENEKNYRHATRAGPCVGS
jgi:hypothetical protein